MFLAFLPLRTIGGYFHLTFSEIFKTNWQSNMKILNISKFLEAGIQRKLTILKILENLLKNMR